MQSIVARVSAEYRVVIPKLVREALHLQPQDNVLFLLDGDTVILRPQPASFTETTQGLHKEIWPDPDTWLEQERVTWE